MSLDTVIHDVDFYVEKGRLDYAPAFKARDIKALLDERGALYRALEAALEANCTTAIDGAPPAEDYPTHSGPPLPPGAHVPVDTVVTAAIAVNP